MGETSEGGTRAPFIGSVWLERAGTRWNRGGNRPASWEGERDNTRRRFLCGLRGRRVGRLWREVEGMGGDVAHAREVRGGRRKQRRERQWWHGRFQLGRLKVGDDMRGPRVPPVGERGRGKRAREAKQTSQAGQRRERREASSRGGKAGPRPKGRGGRDFIPFCFYLIG